MQGNALRHGAKLVALGALFLIPLTPLIVVNNFYFPFITGKAFFFRILVEIAFSAWVVLAIIDKEYRPRFSWVGASVVLFVGWMFVADLFAVNVEKAFFSNFERMEGWILLAHLLIFFFVSSSVLGRGQRWRAWFLTSIAVSVYVAGHSLLQLAGLATIHQGSTRIDSSLGNSAYFAIYLLFNVFIACWLAITERIQAIRWALILISVIEGVLIFFTETRGAILGLVGALIFCSLLALITLEKKQRYIAGYVLVGLLLVVSSFYFARNTDLIQENRIFKRVASISLADGATRFTIWSIAGMGLADRPVTGWGQEGFNYVFNTYYNPSLYNQEHWFDRAHNTFIDWLVAGGVPGFLLYVLLFVSALFLLWTRSKFSRSEQILLTGALVGYAIHNFFVFDNLYSYIYFFAIMAMIHHGSSISLPRLEKLRVLDNAHHPVLTAVTGAVLLVGVYAINVPGMRASSDLIKAMTPSKDGVANLEAFTDLLKHPSFARQEIREQLVSTSVRVVGNKEATNEVRTAIVLLAANEMEKQLREHPGDARSELQAATTYRILQQPNKALEHLNSAAKFSPAKPHIYIQIGLVQWDIGDTQKAQEAFDIAYQLAPAFPSLATYSAAGHIVNGDKEGADGILHNAFGNTVVDQGILVNAYYLVKDYDSLSAIWKLRVDHDDATEHTWIELASLNFLAGNNDGAASAIKEAKRRFPKSIESIDSAYKQLQESTESR